MKKDRFTLHVLLEGTIKGEPRKLEYTISSTDTDKFMNSVLSWAKEHKSELLQFFDIRAGPASRGESW